MDIETWRQLHEDMKLVGEREQRRSGQMEPGNQFCGDPSEKQLKEEKEEAKEAEEDKTQAIANEQV